MWVDPTSPTLMIVESPTGKGLRVDGAGRVGVNTALDTMSAAFTVAGSASITNALTVGGAVTVPDGSVARAAVAAGTADHVVINATSTGVLSSEAQLAVSRGGSGAATFTDGGILLGSGTGAFTALGVAANGQIPIGDGTTDPVLATITGTAGELEVSNGAGTITLGLPSAVTGVTLISNAVFEVYGSNIVIVAGGTLNGKTLSFATITNLVYDGGATTGNVNIVSWATP
jgi:hypothetical protein